MVNDFKNQNNIKRDYLICTPGLCKSNGIRVLHNLAIELEKKGFNAYLYNLTFDKYLDGYKYKDTIADIDFENTIVVYPEIYSGNPLGAKYIARYILYFPGKNGGDVTFHDSELIFKFCDAFIDNGEVLTLPYIDTKIFFNDHTEKTKICYFVNKGGIWKSLPELESAIEINMSYPEKREDLAKLLRETKILYSYDDCSGILDEALACGAIVKVIRKNGFEDYKSLYLDIINNYQKELMRFIALTQSFQPATFEPKRVFNNNFRPLCFLKYIIFKYIIKKKHKAELFLWKIKGFVH